jgi:S1-C subfamily serine protease
MGANRTLRIGRSSECEVVIDDDSVSNIHALLSEANGRWLLRDLDSTNGTFLNGIRHSLGTLEFGDEILFGVARRYFNGSDLTTERPQRSLSHEEAQRSVSGAAKPGRPPKRLIAGLVVIAALMTVGVWLSSQRGETRTTDIVRATVFVLLSDAGGEPCSSGSGFLAEKEGRVITNAHVVVMPGCPVIDVFLTNDDGSLDRKPIAAEVVDSDAEVDLAVLSVDPEATRDRTILEIESAEPILGEEVRVFGFPSLGGYSVTATTGVISGIDDSESIRYLKTNAAISPGNSGGPVVDKNGRVVGVATAGVTEDVHSLGLIRPIRYLEAL